MLLPVRTSIKNLLPVFTTWLYSSRNQYWTVRLASDWVPSENVQGKRNVLFPRAITRLRVPPWTSAPVDTVEGSVVRATNEDYHPHPLELSTTLTATYFWNAIRKFYIYRYLISGYTSVIKSIIMILKTDLTYCCKRSVKFVNDTNSAFVKFMPQWCMFANSRNFFKQQFQFLEGRRP